MPETQLTLIKGDKTSSDTEYIDALPVNMYAVMKKIFGLSGYMLSFPGITSYTTGYGQDRGGVYNDNDQIQYRLSGTKFISIDSSGIVTNLGTINGGYLAAMPYSFNTQCIIANNQMFLYDATNGFREVIDADLGDPIDCIWINGYYFLTDGDYIYHTDITDETAISPLKFAAAEFMPDRIIGLSKTQDNKVIVWGRYSSEYFIDAANENFAFSRIESRAQKIGIVATHAKCEIGGNFVVVGGRENESVSVHLFSLGDTKKIATRKIDKLISKYTESDLANIKVESMQFEGTTFVFIHLPRETVCLNITIAESFGIENAWTILKSDTTGDSPYRAINGVFDLNVSKWIFGDKRDSNIGEIDNDVCTQYGVKVESILYSPFVKLETASIDELYIDTIPGYTSSDDATIAFSITTNGATYSSEYWTMYGESLDYIQRFFIRRVGYVRDFIGFKFRAISESRLAFGSLDIKYG